MLDSQVAKSVIDAGMAHGADFVDIFVERNVGEAVSYVDQKVKDIRTGTDYGIGLRVVFGTKAVYGYTNLDDKEELLRIIDVLCAQDRRDPRAVVPQDFTLAQNPDRQTILRGLDQHVPLDEKISLLRAIDQKSRSHQLIKQVDINTIQRWQKIHVFNSEGLEAHDERHYIRLSTSLIAQDGNEQSRAYAGPGGMQGWEFAESIDPEELAETLAKRAVTVLRAKPCPAGKMPVVIDNGFGGVIFHEACGHLLETTAVEKKASVFHDRMGEMIAHSAVSAVDDGVVAQKWGSINIDDEGMTTQKTQLIKDGKLVSFLVDRMGSVKTGYERTGSGRRQSYKFAPASRMRNTYIEAGPHSFDNLIGSVDRGIYAKVMGGGSVSPGTGDFNFAIEEAYMIEGGKIAEAVKGATLIGSGPETLQKISMVGSNFSLAPGMCGSVSGSIPVTVGQPALKVDEILVGGEA
ncbi:TldD/PmbA family protein [Pseudobacteriovorax antillogorgiicola]|uniref:TldD protein n=1 Tax=Pseudobacteriovorax antillogorgiicola TaxID=1513793 RepID=A0A1Y6B840_9BACT|nr:TldD/PmbA family protein [Pseudobacteriovorax antillogorgiicola]TCS58531.1 microcin-processing peptidase 2 [Pseudobacteriovorax antillogorgiicola]SME97885.1 microcin-processing peptidase 2. Unknown type peptidase. MEROPS family U62 [Pseudobacteriovorax antillogorgiicola]